MNAQDAIDISRQGIMTALSLGSPLLIVGMAVGLLIGLMQALTQIQDQTIAFVPKIVAMVAALGLFLPWMIQVMADYSETLISNIPTMIMGG